MSRKNTAQVQLTEQVHAELRLLAGDEGRSLSSMLARLIDEALEARRVAQRRKTGP